MKIKNNDSYLPKPPPPNSQNPSTSSNPPSSPPHSLSSPEPHSSGTNPSIPLLPSSNPSQIPKTITPLNTTVYEDTPQEAQKKPISVTIEQNSNRSPSFSSLNPHTSTPSSTHASSSDNPASAITSPALSSTFTPKRSLTRSYLRESLPKWNAEILVTPKLATHFLGEHFIDGTGLAGQHKGKVLTFLTASFEDPFCASEKLPNTPYGKLIKTGDEIYSKLYQSFEAYLKEIHLKVETNEPFLLAGGWSNQDLGHAIYFHFIPQTDGSLTLEVTNTGAGLTHHHPSLFQDGNITFQTTITIVGIDSSRLKDPLIIKGFYDILMNINKPHLEAFQVSEACNYTEEHIYTHLIPSLGGRLLPPSRNVNDYSLSQIGGTCVTSGLEALAKKMLPLRQYLRLFFHLSLKVLLISHQRYVEKMHFIQQKMQEIAKANPNLDPMKIREQAHKAAGWTMNEPAERELLKKLKESFAKRAQEAYPTAIDSSELEKVHATLKDIEATINNAKNDYLSFVQKKPFVIENELYEFRPFGNITGLKTSASAIGEEINKKDQEERSKALPKTLITLPKIDQLPINEYAASIRNWNLEIHSHWSIANISGTLNFINHIFFKLAIPNVQNDGFQELSNHERIALMRELNELSQLLVRAALYQHINSNYVEPQSYLSLLKGIALQHRLFLLNYSVPTVDPSSNTVDPSSNTEQQSPEKLFLENSKSWGQAFSMLKLLHKQFYDFENNVDFNVYDRDLTIQLEHLESYFYLTGQLSQNTIDESSWLDLQTSSRWMSLSSDPFFLTPLEQFTSHLLNKFFPNWMQFIPEKEKKFLLLGNEKTRIQYVLYGMPTQFFQEFSIWKQQVSLFFLLQNGIDQKEAFSPNAFLNLNEPIIQQNWQVTEREMIRSIKLFNSENTRYSSETLPGLTLSKGVLDHLKTTISYGQIAENPQKFISTIGRYGGFPSYSDKECLELGFLISKESNVRDQKNYLQVVKTIAYFSQHLDHLVSEDFQALCRVMIFNKNSLTQAIKNSPELLVPLIESFLHKGIKRYTLDFQPHVLSFFWHLAFLLEPYMHPSVSLESSSQVNRGKEIRNSIVLLFSQNINLSVNEKRKLHQLLISTYNISEKFRDSFQLKAEDITYIVKGLEFLNQHPFVDENKTYHDLLLDQQVESVRNAYINQIVTFFEDESNRNRILNTVFKEILPDQINKSTQWKLERAPLYCTLNGAINFNVYEGALYHLGKKLNRLPKTILQNPNFKKLFPRIDYLATLIGQDSFEFLDDQGITTRILLQPKSIQYPILIQKKLKAHEEDPFKDIWYEYTPNWPGKIEDIPPPKRSQWESGDFNHALGPNLKVHQSYSPFGSQYLIDNHTLWVSLNKEKRLNPYEISRTTGQILFLDKTNRIAYECEFENKKIKGIIRLPSPLTTTPRQKMESESKILVDSSGQTDQDSYDFPEAYFYSKLSNIYSDLENTFKSPLLCALSQIELIPYIHISTFSHGRRLFELPRLGLRFVTKDGKAYCTSTIGGMHFKGYYIDTEGGLPYLQDFQNYLILRNDSGVRKVIFPRCEFSFKEPTTKGSLITNGQLDLNSRPHFPVKTKALLVYDVRKGKPFTHSAEGNLFQVYLWLAKNKPRKALYYLKFVASHRAFSATEFQLFNWIMEYPNKSENSNPEIFSVCLYSALRWHQNQSRPGLKPHRHFQSTEFTGTSNYLLTDYFNKMRDMYQNYLQGERFIGKLKLKTKDEIMLLNWILSKMPNLEYKSRMLFINPNHPLPTLPKPMIRYFQTKLMPEAGPFSLQEMIESGKKYREGGLSSTYQSYIKSNRVPINVYFPSITFRIEFETNYRMAKSHDPRLLIRLNLMAEKSYAFVVDFLKKVFEFPDKFPPYEELEKFPFDKIQWLMRSAKDLYLRDPIGLVNYTSEELTPLEKETKSKNEDVQLQPSDVFQKGDDEILKLLSSYLMPHSELPPFVEASQLKELFTTIEGQKLLSSQELKEIRSCFPIEIDAPIRSVNARIMKEIEDASLQLNTPDYVFSPHHEEQLIDIESRLSSEQISLFETINSSKAALLEAINYIPENLAGVHRNVGLQGRVFEKITFEQMLPYFARNDIKSLIEQNPFLPHTKNAVMAFKEAIIKLLSLETRLQQSGRILSTIRETLSTMRRSSRHPHEPSQEKQLNYLANKLHREITESRCYDPMEHPEFLLFEYIAEIMLRPQQVHNLKLMLSSEGNLNIVLQMIMGSGKTAVLLPILALKNADKHHLSIIITTQALYPTLLKNIFIQSKDVFQQVAVPLLIDADTDLEKLLHEFETIIQDQKYVITTNASLAYLMLSYWKYLALAANEPESNKHERSIVTIKKLLNLLLNQGKAVGDEVDQLLNVLHKILFTHGDAKEMKLEHRALIAQLYLFLQEDEDLKKIASQFLSGMTQTFYKQEIYAPFIQRFLNYLIMPPSERPIPLLDVSLEPLCAFLREMSQDEDGLKMIKDYLFNFDYDKRFKERIKQAGFKIENLLNLLQAELNRLLAETLSKECDTSFGFPADLNTNPPISVPYDYNNTPSRTAQHGLCYEGANLTLQVNVKKGIPHEVIGRHLKRLAARIASSNAEDAKQVQEEVNKEIASFSTVTDLVLQRVTPEQTKMVTDALNGNPIKKYEYLIHQILVKIPVYSAMMELTSQDLPEMLKVFQGVTGSPWNHRSYSSKLRTITDEGTEGITMTLLWKKSRNDLHIIHSTEFSQIVKDLLRIGKTAHAHDVRSAEPYFPLKAIIDNGSLFTGKSNIEVATEILKHLPRFFKGVNFYQDNKLRVLKRNGDIVTKDQANIMPHELFTYYDQSHARGIDLKQMIQAKAVLTVGKDSLFNDFSQGAWRLRGLMDQYQSIALAFSEEVHQIIRKSLERAGVEGIGLNPNKVALEHILAFTYLTEEEQEKFHNVMSLKEKIAHQLKWKIHEMRLETSSFFCRNVLTKISEECFLIPGEDEPRLSWGNIEKLETAQKVMDQLIQRRVSLLEQIIAQLRTGLAIHQKVLMNATESEIAETFYGGEGEQKIQDEQLLKLKFLVDYMKKATRTIDHSKELQEMILHLERFTKEMRVKLDQLVHMAIEQRRIPEQILNGEESRQNTQVQVQVSSQSQTQTQTQTQTQMQTQTQITSKHFPQMGGEFPIRMAWSGLQPIASIIRPSTLEEAELNKKSSAKTRQFQSFSMSLKQLGESVTQCPFLFKMNELLFSSERKPTSLTAPLSNETNFLDEDRFLVSYNFFPFDAQVHREKIAFYNGFQPTFNYRLIALEKYEGEAEVKGAEELGGFIITGVVMITQDEAAELNTRLRSYQSSNRRLYLYQSDLPAEVGRGKIYQSSVDAVDDSLAPNEDLAKSKADQALVQSRAYLERIKILENSKSFQMMMLKLDFLNGELSYLGKRHLLTEWLSSLTPLKRASAKDFFEKVVLSHPHNKDKIPSYPHSFIFSQFS